MTALEDRLRAALTAKSNAVTLSGPDTETIPDDVVRLVPDDVVRLVPDDVVPDDAVRSRPRFAAFIAAAAAAVVLALAVGALVAGSGSGRTPDSAGNRAEIPWSQVGADWTPMVLARDHSDASGMLYLVDPSGRRYEICSLPSPFGLVERWSASTGRVLVTPTASQPDGVSKALLVDLRTGSQTNLNVPSRYSTLQFVEASQRLILATSPLWMLTITDSGRRVSEFPGSEFWGSAISPDGSRVAAGNPAGLTVFDAATGRPIRTLARPAGYRDCVAITWTSGSDVSGRCYSRTPTGDGADFLFSATGRHPPTPESVPSGWDAVSFSDGVVAIEHDSTVDYEPRDVRFARVGTGGRLTPLTLPRQLSRAGWRVTSIGTDSVLIERAADRPNAAVDELARWNPLTARFVSLFQAERDHARLISYAGWRESRG